MTFDWGDGFAVVMLFVAVLLCFVFVVSISKNKVS